MIVLDTTVLIKRIRNDDLVTNRLKKFNKSEIAITSISIYELYLGAYISKNNRANKIQDIVELTKNIQILIFDKASAKKSAYINSQLIENKIIQNPSDWMNDVLIAGIVNRHGAKLITYDSDFEKMKALCIEKWSAI